MLGLDPAEAPPGRRADWLAARLRAAIADGTLAAGSYVPPGRELAADLGFARGTVVEAYQRLVEETLLVAEPRRGIRVEARSRSAHAANGMVHASTGRTTAGGPQPSEAHGVVDLAHGVPDVSAFPRAAWLRAEREVLDAATAAQLGYPDPAGMPELRETLAEWLARSRGVAAPPDRVLVTGGVAGSLSLLAQVLAARDERVIAVEDPSAAGSRLLLERWMPGVAGVAVDDDGIDVGALSATGARTAVVTPAHQYPTGVVLAPDRRRALLSWARDSAGLIVEDDYDAEHRYDRRPVRALQPAEPDRVAYTSSLSKTLAPALRMGWLVPPAALHGDLVGLRQATDLGPPAIPQLALALLLRRGIVERHLRTVRVRHRRRRDALVDGLRAAFPDVRIGGVAAGLHLVVDTEGADDAELAARLAAQGIAVQPLSTLHLGAPARSGLVLHYGGQPEHVLAAASPRIAAVLRASR
ncbi:PLP-dependent aminotransferase family protein [Microbacterium kyungheense]|uniref:GntR family transcriptional regulator/MocR family aminotransferase n=1 Tax=Microbacterium kyungheense TaxID=1263636 RepID=A0A543EFA4_9MICO|nr:PLP-dependent aminotransferase family protein [Microbacterium kyungheense]TQM20268.1 GntR family transcriptional regulator/MocR family aminotransferase [Microbacterium kyungheense]